MLSSEKGFSLIELIVVVAIIGILTAIAIPIYSDYRERAFRDAAKAALAEGAQNMERFFSRNNQYTGAVVGDPAAGDQVLQFTEGRRYQLTLVTPVATTFTITATSVDLTVACPVMTIDQAGATTPAACW